MDFKLRQGFFICKVVNGKQIYELRFKVGEYLIFGPTAPHFLEHTKNHGQRSSAKFSLKQKLC